MSDDRTGTRFFSKYRDIILFNKNLIISGSVGVLSGAYVAQLYAQVDNNKIANSLLALVTEYLVYIPLFVFLFYVDNRHRYHNPLTGKKDTALIRQDIKKLLTAFSISEVVYSLTKASSQYQFLQINLQPYQASIVSSLIGWVVFFVLINYLTKLVKLFKKQ
ncbi:MAG: hypothetical protein ACREA3_03565 [Nitrosotalea sp.]